MPSWLVFWTPDLWKPLIFCAAATGMRAGELLALRWQDFDAWTRKLTIQGSLWRGRVGSPKTESSRRVIWISHSLCRILTRHRRSSVYRAASDFIFCRPDGRPCDQDVLRTSVLYPSMDQAGIVRGRRTHGFHLFRHTAASIVHERTGSLKHAQILLGHARQDTTRQHLRPRRRGESARGRRSRFGRPSHFLPTFCPPRGSRGGESPVNRRMEKVRRGKVEKIVQPPDMAGNPLIGSDC